MKPLGIRRNNPGNVEYNGIRWTGLDEHDGHRFCRFISPEYGIRCMFIILRTYQKKYGLVTLERMIPKYAPCTENHTENYISNVSSWTGLPRDEPFNIEDEDIAVSVLRGFIRQECGYCPFSDDELLSGIDLAY